jgi:hypothetical protein
LLAPFLFTEQSKRALAVGEFGARFGAAVAAIELARELLNRAN